MIIMKFGGTSIANAEAISRVIDIIKPEPRKKIVIVSAIAEATNILTRIFILASQNRLDQCASNLIEFKKRHEKMVEELLINNDLRLKTQTKIYNYFQELNDTLEEVASISKHYEPNMAKTLAFGELLSSTILHAAMLEHGIKNVLIDARKIIITDSNHQNRQPILEEIIKRTPRVINQYLNDQTVITQGFISGNLKGETTNLGREGSDLSASLIGMAMDAKEIQIWTDVNGIMTGDPKKIKNTKNIPNLSFNEASELSMLGAKVIHPLTIEPATKKNIPVKILSSLDPKLKGTLITKEPSKNKVLSITYRENNDNKTATIGIIGKFTHNDQKIPGKIAKILDSLDIKMIAYEPSKNSIAVTVQKNDLIKALQKLHDVFFMGSDPPY